VKSKSKRARSRKVNGTLTSLLVLLTSLLTSFPYSVYKVIYLEMIRKDLIVTTLGPASESTRIHSPRGHVLETGIDDGEDVTVSSTLF